MSSPSTQILLMRLQAQVQTVVDALDAEPDSTRPPLLALAATRSLALTVEDAMRALVRQCKAHGATWQDIGDVLGTTRQAAYQRFPQRQETPDVTAPLTDATDKAVALFRDYTSQNWEAVRRDFDPTMEAQLPESHLAAGWTQLLQHCGAFQRQGEPQEKRIGDMAVVDVPLTFDHALLIGRVAYDGEGRIAGLFVLQPAAAGWPEA